MKLNTKIILPLLLISALLILLAGCFPGLTVTPPVTSPEVGDSYGGGKVAYILQPGESNGVYSYDANVQHGLS